MHFFEVSMPVAAYVDDSRKFVILDRTLVIVTSVFLLSHAVAYYVSAHSDGFETIIVNLLLFFVGGALAIIVFVRIAVLIFFRLFRKSWLASPALPACVTLLAIYPFIGPEAAFYVIDQFRFQMNKSFYVTKVEESDSSPKFVVFDWGSSGFVAWRTNYFLVFDENNSIARGLQDPMDMPLPNEPVKCSTSVVPLYGSFYSTTVYCDFK
jgi:hypothetical protein